MLIDLTLLPTRPTTPDSCGIVAGAASEKNETMLGKRNEVNTLPGHRHETRATKQKREIDTRAMALQKAALSSNGERRSSWLSKKK